MTWLELKNNYIKNHYSKMLTHPDIHVNALLEMEEILSSHYPDIINDPGNIKKYSKEGFTEMIRRQKPTSEINEVDKEVIDGLYEVLT